MQRRRHGIDEYRQRLRYFLGLSGLTRKAGERLPYKTQTTPDPQFTCGLTKWRARISPFLPRESRGVLFVEVSGLDLILMGCGHCRGIRDDCLKRTRQFIEWFDSLVRSFDNMPMNF